MNLMWLILIVIALLAMTGLKHMGSSSNTHKPHFLWLENTPPLLVQSAMRAQPP
ncbi:MAG TPA: hypothetical protein VLA49_04025 [Anaerolineales bacterium]|nr:hypothetical protein [Anaerolineales bacterium]